MLLDWPIILSISIVKLYSIMKKFLLLLVLYVSNAGATVNQEIEPLAREAHRLFAHDIPFSIPDIEYINIAAVQDKLCGGKCPSGVAVKGFYYRGIIFLSDKLDLVKDDWDKSYFIHEMIHYYQSVADILNNGEKETCSERQILELQAYTIQNQYLKGQGKFIKDSDIKDLVKASTSNCATPLSVPSIDQQRN